MQKMTTQKMCLLAVLCAMQVVLSRIAAINVGDYLKISFKRLNSYSSLHLP